MRSRPMILLRRSSRGCCRPSWIVCIDTKAAKGEPKWCDMDFDATIVTEMIRSLQEEEEIML